MRFLFGLTLTCLGFNAQAFQVNSIDPNVITVQFDSVVNSPSAVNVDNYTIYTKSTNAIVINKAELFNNGQSIALRLNNAVGEFFAVGVTNVINALGSNVVDQATSYLSDYSNTIIGTTNDPSPSGETLTPARDAFLVSSGGTDIGGTNDHCRFVYQLVDGDFEMMVKVNDLRGPNPFAKAGLMAREYLSPGSRSLGAYFTAIDFSGNNNNQLITIARTSTNGASGSNPVLTLNAFYWLRMTRTNNTFNFYYGTNGLNWSNIGTGFFAWNKLMYIGMAVTARTNGAIASADFSSSGISAARPGDGVQPTVSAYVYNSTNLIVKWQRTPRDFTVQVATNLLVGTNVSSLIESNATQWGFLMIPVFDTALTGTNAAVPTSGRYMTIPLNLFSGNSMFIRLAQVEKVIPDPSASCPESFFHSPAAV